jgi:hypothetical protein
MVILPDELNRVMEFDHVIEVHEGGHVTERDDIYPPELIDDEIMGDGWSLLNGYSGQYGYRGPIMHSSEFIGGGMARDILATPGVYVALVAYSTDGDEPDGWAVATREA